MLLPQDLAGNRCKLKKPAARLFWEGVASSSDQSESFAESSCTRNGHGSILLKSKNSKNICSRTSTKLVN